MPRTTATGISALIGQEVAHAPIFLVKWELGSPQYLSSGPAVSYGGNSYAANRVKSIPTFEPGLIDRNTRDFSKLEIELSNLADDGSSTFPFTALDASTIFEDAKLTIYAYSPDAADAVLVWWGFSGRPKFSGDNKTCTLSATFFWDSFDLDLPYAMTHQNGFSPTEVTGQSNDSLGDDNVIPLVYGAGDIKIRPVIYDKRVDGQQLYVNFIVSGCNGQPFSAGDLIAANVKLFAVSEATSIEWQIGSSTQTAPANLTRFPDGAAHINIAYACAVFQITNEIKDRIDNLTPDDIKLQLANGRPLLDTTIPSENAVLILKDLMRDPNFGLGLPSTLFDATAVTAAANYVGTRYQSRYEIKEPKSASETIQNILGDCHCFITFDNGLIQIRAKKNTESGGVSFATIDSGGSGRKIHNDSVDVYEKDFSEIINQVAFKYRRKNRNKRLVTLYDPTAQARAGGLTKKVVNLDIDEWENGGLYDETQVKIVAAISIREDQNGDLFAEFSTPFWDGIDVAPGDVINVYSPDIFGANNTFRVIKQSIDTDGLCLIHFTCQVYKSAIYNDDSVGLGVDLLRGGDSTDAQGRPPDVSPVSLAVVDVTTNDVEGKDATIRGVWTYPTVDLAAEAADGIFREYPISEVELRWHYTDEGFNQSRVGASVKYPTATADFHVPFFKSRSIECFFMAIGHNRARSPLGYVPDPTKTTSLTGNFAANPAITANVVSSSLFTVNDYVQIEKEIDQLASKTATSLTFVSSGGNRVLFFDSSAIAHPSGTEVSVAKKSYPSLTLALGRRFTYPIVTGLVAIDTGDGVRFRWADPDADNIETFFLYWSTDSDALTNAAKLGSATPTWYTTDPYTPPSGVNLSLNDDRAHKVTQNEIGSAGTIVYARVAASNRRNFSSQLSASAQGTSTGATAVPTATPNDPGLTDLVENVVNLDTEESDARVKVRIWANKANHADTFALVGAQDAVAVFRRGGDTDAEVVKFGGVIADQTQTNVSVGGILPLGQLWDWTSNIISNGAGKSKSTGSSYQFRTGAVIAVEPGDVLTVPAPTFGTISRLEGSNKEDLVPITITQDGTNIILFKKLVIEKSINGGAWNFVQEINLKHEETLYASNVATKTFNTTIKRKAAVTAQYRCWVKAVGGKLSATTTSASQGATTDDGTAVPGAVVFPSSIATNTIDGDPEKGLARLAFNISTVSGTFGANNIAKLSLIFLRRDDDGTVDSGSSFYVTKPITAGEGGLSTVAMGFFQPMGQKLRLLTVKAENGEKSTDSSGTFDFTSGGILRVNPADAKTVPAPTFQSQPAADGNKLASFTVRLTQDGVDIVWFKHLLIEVSYGGGTFRSIEGSPIGLKAIDELYTGVSALKDFVFSVKRKPGVTLDVRATAKAVGGKASATTTATQLTASTDDVADDTAAPGGTLTAPTVKKLKRSALKIDLTAPTTGNLRLRRANVFISNTAHTLWLSAADLTSSTGTESVGSIQTNPTGGVNIAVSRDTLEGIFGVSATIHVYASWTNDVGTSSVSGNTAYALSSGETAARGQESTAPATTVSPTLDWKVTGDRLAGAWDKPSGNIDALLGYYAVFTDSAGTAFMDRVTGGSVSEASAERFVTDTGFKSRVRKADINAAFSTGLKIKVTPVWQVNNVATRGTAASSSLTALGNEILSDSLDAVRVVDVSTLMAAPQNMVANGEFGFSTATSTTLNSWRSWDKSTGISQANTTAISTTSTNIIWEQSDHRVKWISNAEALVQKLRSLVPGDFYAVTFMAKAVGSPGSPIITVKLIKASSATDETEASPSITLSGLSTTDYKMFGAVFRFATTGTPGSQHWLSLQTVSTLSGSNYIAIDRVMYVRGKQPFAFIPSSQNEVGNTGTEDLDVTPNSIGISPDVGNPGGSQRGWFDSGSGGNFNVL